MAQQNRTTSQRSMSQKQDNKRQNGVQSLFDEKKDVDVMQFSYPRMQGDLGFDYLGNLENVPELSGLPPDGQYPGRQFEHLGDPFFRQFEGSSTNGVNTNTNGTNTSNFTGITSNNLTEINSNNTNNTGNFSGINSNNLTDTNGLNSLNVNFTGNIFGNNFGLKQEWDDDETVQLPEYEKGSEKTGFERPAPRKEKPRIKSAHNVIEQRYRNKINDKFTALQYLVPTLRVIARKKTKTRRGSVASRDDDDSDDCDYLPASDNGEDLEGLEPARKLNKGTILAKSIEYIKFLEKKNDRMKMERHQLVERARMLGVAVDDSLLHSKYDKR